MIAHPFRFGVHISEARDPREWRTLARRLEDLGYSTMFIPDHFQDQWGALVALTTAAEATTDLRVGSLVFNNDYRNPVLLAKEIATLDLISEGRVEVGLGAGWQKADYDASGISFDGPGVRIDRMAEALQIMKDLWSTGSSTRSGTYYQVASSRGVPRPHTTPHPPIIIGGGGERILGIAGREADIVSLSPLLNEGFIGPQTVASARPNLYEERIAWVRAAAGERFDALEFQILTYLVQIVPDREQLLTNVARMFDITADELAKVPIVLVGTIEQICETLEQRREEWGFSYWVVHPGDIEAFAPVVAALTGK